MSAISYLIQKDADAPVTLAAAGVTSAVLSLRANGVDSFAFVQSNDWLAAPSWPYGSKISLIERTVDGAVTTDVCWFVGKVRTIPRAASGGGAQAVKYIAYNASYDLQRTDYSQLWAYTDAAGALQTQYEPTVVLGEDNDGNRRKNGETVADVVAWAIARGHAIASGTIAAGVYVPFDERDNIKCWDAIVSMLRYTPDYVFWWDYDNLVAGEYVPKAMLTAPAAMAVVTKAVTVPEEAAFTPRSDIQAPGVLCVFRWTGEYDGRAVKSRETQSSGDIDAAERISLVFDLEGSRSSFITQDVEVEAYPTVWTDAAGKAFLALRIPWLSQLADADWSVESVERTGVELYESALKSGCVPSWTGEHTEDEVFTVEILYQVKSSVAPYNILDRARKKLTFSAKSTDATTKTYRRLTSWIAAEPVPSDLAGSLYTSWNRLHYDGSIVIHSQNPSIDARPGRLLRVTGGLAEWETMDAVVQSVDIDIGSGKATIATGTCGRLEADNLMAVYRAARGRRFSYLRLGRDSGDGADGNQFEGASGTPNDSVADGPPAVERQRFAVEAENPTDALAHRIDLAPELVAFASAADKASQVLQPRELSVITASTAEAVTVNRCQVLASQPYGTPDIIAIGGAALVGIEDGGVVVDAGEVKLEGTTESTPPAVDNTPWGWRNSTDGYGWIPMLTLQG